MNEAPRQVRLPNLLPHATKPEIDFRAIVALLRRQFRTIIVTSIGGLAVTLLFVLQLERQYTATALVVVDARQSEMLGFESSVSNAFGLNPAVDTEVEIARSPSVLARVAQELPAESRMVFLPGPSILDRALSLVGLAEPLETTAAPSWDDLPQTVQAGLIENLSERFDIKRLGITKIISVSANAKSPELAAALANALTDAYLNEQIEANLDASQKAVSFLRERVERLASEISAQEAALDDFVNSTLAEYGTPESEQLLRRLERERAGQVQDVSTLKGLEAALEAEDYNRLSALLDSATGSFNLRWQQLTELQGSGILEPAKLTAVRQDLAALEQEVRTTAEHRTAEIRAAISASEKNAADIRAELDTILTRQDIPRDVSVKFFRLQRDAETKRNLYGSFLTKLRQAEQQAVFDLPDSRVVASATPPNRPSFPPLRIIAGAALVISICAGIGMAVVRDYYIGGFVDAEQLESAVGVPVLASIPVYRPRDRKPVESAIFSDPLSGYAESIRRVRLGIEAFAQDSGCLCVFVTSTLPEEGKTTIALALARAFALTGRKTLLIDADLRHPSAGKLASVRAGYTLTQYLTGEVPEDDVSKLVSEPEPETGLSLLFGSDVRTGATDVPLMSERFRGLISRARADFDVVVLDTSPVGLVVDPQIIARNADVGLYVVRYASTNQNAVRESLKQLRSEAQVVYGVLNQVASNTTLDSGYGYYGQPRSMA